MSKKINLMRLSFEAFFQTFCLIKTSKRSDSAITNAFFNIPKYLRVSNQTYVKHLLGIRDKFCIFRSIFSFQCAETISRNY